MRPRIGLFITIFLAVSSVARAFTPPALPKTTHGVYLFEKTNSYGATLRTLDGGVFSLTIGFEKAVVAGISPTAYREHAQELIDRISKTLSHFEEKKNNSEISISRVYPTIRELMLTVVVHDANMVDKVRTDLIELLKKQPGVIFAGNSGVMHVD